MPIFKPRELLSDKRIELEPDRMTSKIQLIILMDVAGYKSYQICNAIGMTPGRLSIIRRSPLYEQEKARRQEEFNQQVLNKKSDKVVAGDPVENKLKDLALDAVKKYKELLTGAKSEFVAKATADSILDRTGYKAHTDKTIVSVEVTEKMSERFERALKYSQPVVRTTFTKESGS